MKFGLDKLFELKASDNKIRSSSTFKNILQTMGLDNSVNFFAALFCLTS